MAAAGRASRHRESSGSARCAPAHRPDWYRTPADRDLLPHAQERMRGGTIALSVIRELLQQSRFDDAVNLEQTALNYLKLYNHHIAQGAIDGKTPFLALNRWRLPSPRYRPEGHAHRPQWHPPANRAGGPASPAGPCLSAGPVPQPAPACQLSIKPGKRSVRSWRTAHRSSIAHGSRGNPMEMAVEVDQTVVVPLGQADLSDLNDHHGMAADFLGLHDAAVQIG
jgi:hypothetical protein